MLGKHFKKYMQTLGNKEKVQVNPTFLETVRDELRNSKRMHFRYQIIRKKTLEMGLASAFVICLVA